MDKPVIAHCAFCLAHAPDLVRHGSKSRREIAHAQGVGFPLQAPVLVPVAGA